MRTHSQQDNQSREQVWIQLLAQWKESGEKITSFCQKRKLPISSFYQWRNRLYPDYLKRPHKGIKKKISAPLFVPIEIKSDDSKSNVEEVILYYPNGCHLRLGKYFDIEMIIKINQAMGVQQC